MNPRTKFRVLTWDSRPRLRDLLLDVVACFIGLSATLPRMAGLPGFSSPTSSPFLDPALAQVPLSSPSRRDGRSSTDIVAFQLDDERQGYFDAGPRKTEYPVEDPVVRPTGIPLVSPEDLRSQETSSTDKLDKEFQDGEELILAQAEMEIGQTGMGKESERRAEEMEGEAPDTATPKAKKRKRSTSSELQALPDNQPDALDLETAPGVEDAWDYTDDAAYAASKFGGLAEYMRHKRMKL